MQGLAARDVDPVHRQRCSTHHKGAGPRTKCTAQRWTLQHFIALVRRLHLKRAQGGEARRE